MNRLLCLGLPFQVSLKDSLVLDPVLWLSPVGHVVALAGEDIDRLQSRARNQARGLVERLRSQEPTITPCNIHPSKDIVCHLQIVAGFYFFCRFVCFQFLHGLIGIGKEYLFPVAIRAGNTRVVSRFKFITCQHLGPVAPRPVEVEKVGLREAMLLETGLGRSTRKENR